MQREYFDQLPDDVGRMVTDTEDAIGFPVDVVVAPERARGVPGEPDALACQIEIAAARILTPDVAQFRPGSVLHELLHIRRILVEGVPRLIDCEDYEPWTPQVTSALTMHDNCIEHLTIVPRELGRFPERLQHWQGLMERTWERLASGTVSELDRRQGALANWTFLRLVLPQSPTVSTARDVLTRFGLLDTAERLCEELRPVLTDKERMVWVWFRHLQVPLRMASLEYFVPREGRHWEVPLAEPCGEA